MSSRILEMSITQKRRDLAGYRARRQHTSMSNRQHDIVVCAGYCGFLYCDSAVIGLQQVRRDHAPQTDADRAGDDADFAPAEIHGFRYGKPFPYAAAQQLRAECLPFEYLSGATATIRRSS